MAVCLFMGMPAGVYIHELGHQAACLHLGYESGGVIIDMSGSSHRCMFDGGTSDAEILLVRAAGGGLASVVFGVAGAAFWLSARMHGAVRLVGHIRVFILAGFIPQFINLILEAGFNHLYNDATRALGVMCGIFLVLCIWYAYLPKHCSDRRWLGRIRRQS